MIEYLLASVALLAIGFVKFKGERFSGIRRFLYLLAVFPLIFFVVLLSSAIIVAVVVALVAIFVVGYVYLIFSRKRKGRVIVVK